jgi:FHS family glucose/mannose:H+ symporter-like MFS transporter
VKPSDASKILAFAFPLSGAVTTLLGPLLPFLIPRWSLTDSQAGQYFLAQFVSSTLGAAASGTAAARLGQPGLIAASYFLIGAAVALLGIASRTTGLLCVAAYGFLLGLSIPTINQLAAVDGGSRRLSRLNQLNMAWCLGAILSPPLIVAVLRRTSPAQLTASLGALCALAGIASLRLRSHLPLPCPVPAMPPARSRAVRYAALAAGLFLFLCVGVENGLNGWLTLYASRTSGASPVTAAATLSAFWAAILLARFVAALTATHLSPHRWLTCCLALTLLATTSIVTLQHAPALLLVAAFTAGLGIGPIFPTAVAAFHDSTGPDAARLIGFVFAAAGLGGGVLPWLIGTVSSSTGSLRLALSLAPFAIISMVPLTRRL